MSPGSTDSKHGNPDDATPGRPSPAGSRQQTHSNQSSQSGSPQTDRDLTHKGSNPVPAKPPGAK